MSGTRGVGWGAPLPKTGDRREVHLPEFLCCNPVVKERRIGIVEVVDELLKGALLLRGPVQLEQHVVHGQAVRNPPAIILRSCFRAGVAPQRDQSGLLHPRRCGSLSLSPASVAAWRREF